jgi:hypothetical protein
MKTPPGEAIEIPISCIDFPTELSVIVLQTYMLFPDAPAARAKALKIFERELARRQRRNNTAVFVDTAEEKSNTMALKQLQHSLREEFERAMATGFILIRIVQESALDRSSEDARMKTIKAKMSGFFKIIEISPKTFENTVWNKYRKVSHFWAAFVSMAWFDPATVFPCTFERLPDFLAIAEEFRRRGETAKKTWKSPDYVLTPGECFTLPKDLELPAISVISVSWIPCSPEYG